MKKLAYIFAILTIVSTCLITSCTEEEVAATNPSHGTEGQSNPHQWD